MNQIEMNKIAINFIMHESCDVAKKLEKVLAEDVKDKCKEMPGMTVHHIHNMAIFDLLLMINCVFTIHGDATKETAQEYYQLGESLRPKFFEIVEILKDFMAEEEPENKND